jgi:hypothetical protein
MDETSCQLVSSRGLLKSCDKRNRDPQSSSRHIDQDLLKDLKDGDTVHICSWLTITRFVKEFVPRLTKRVIMVTNDSDMDAPICEKPTGPGDTIAKEEIRNFIESDLCIHWFTQNCTIDHPKVSPIPIGLDYHTFWTQTNSPQEQEHSLINIVKQRGLIEQSSLRAKGPKEQRMLKCYANFHFSIYNKYYTQERIDCINQVARDCVDFERSYLDRKQCWNTMMQYIFILSPAGMGLDCHRTWEAIALGCIPVLRRMGLAYERIYDDLPVLWVDKWSDINKELLLKTVEEFNGRQFKMEKLTLAYWVNKINSKKVNL